MNKYTPEQVGEMRRVVEGAHGYAANRGTIIEMLAQLEARLEADALPVTDADVAAAIRTLLDDETRLFPDKQDIVIGAYRSKCVEAEWLTAERDKARAEVEQFKGMYECEYANVAFLGGQLVEARVEIERLKEEVEGVTP